MYGGRGDIGGGGSRDERNFFADVRIAAAVVTFAAFNVVAIAGNPTIIIMSAWPP